MFSYASGASGSSQPPLARMPGRDEGLVIPEENEVPSHSQRVARDQVILPLPRVNIPRQAPLRVPERFNLDTPPGTVRNEGNQRPRGGELRSIGEVLADVLMSRPISISEARATRHIRRRMHDPEYEDTDGSESGDYESAQDYDYDSEESVSDEDFGNTHPPGTVRVQRPDAGVKTYNVEYILEHARW
jgi:hypothetical protein